MVIQGSFSQERKNGINTSNIDTTEVEKVYHEPTIVGQKKLTEFTLWDYLDGNKKWKGKEGYVSYLKETDGGLFLSKIRIKDEIYYSISYEEHNDSYVETTSLLLSEESTDKLFYPEKINMVCILDESKEEYFYLTRKSIYSRLTKTVYNQVDEFTKYKECTSFLPIYISNEGPIRFVLVGLNKSKNQEYYLDRFENGSYIEVDSVTYYDTFNKVFTDSKFTDDFIVEDSKNNLDNYSQSREESNYYFSGSGINNTERFTVKSPWRISWTNDGQLISGYLIDKNGDLVEVIINSDENRGTNNIYKTGTFHIKVNTIGNWVIRIHD
ncbi:hypothetical protein ACKGJO_10420 [Gracilimonas sp. Q87]|uniref:hypothetical protein n=1 Tax=Gracilimonas sp. Q87 TaxID=3384766 RepID=UPI0039841263